MKIAWFTPLSQRSAIARFSIAVTAQLSKLADVELWCFDDDETRPCSLPVKRFRSAAAVKDHVLQTYDLAIYNFGNYVPFHRDIYLVSKQRPGICILHDFIMHHFFAGYYLNELRNPAAYELLIERTYGLSLSAGERIWESNQVVQYPLFEEAIGGALGVITHSSFFRRHVEECFAGPVTSIPLAYEVQPADPENSRAKLGLGPDQTVALTVGHVNPNKQIERVISAFAQLDLPPNSFVYAVAGQTSPQYERTLRSAARQAGLGEVVRFLGHVSDEVLSSYLSAADFCVNLRFPTMEGASASVIEEMLLGKPVVVTDTGFFSELPDDCVIKIAPADDAGLAGALRKLVEDSSSRRQMGARAKAYAGNQFTAEAYAKGVIEFAWQVQAMKPLLTLADAVGAELSRMGAAAESKVVDQCAREINATFVANSSTNNPGDP